MVAAAILVQFVYLTQQAHSMNNNFIGTWIPLLKKRQLLSIYLFYWVIFPSVWFTISGLTVRWKLWIFFFSVVNRWVYGQPADREIGNSLIIQLVFLRTNSHLSAGCTNTCLEPLFNPWLPPILLSFNFPHLILKTNTMGTSCVGSRTAYLPS